MKGGEFMDIFEKAKAIRDMTELLGLSQSEAAKRIGVSQSYIANKVRILKLEESVKKYITENGLSERHARALLSVDGEDMRLNFARKMHEMNLSVSASEALIDIYLDDKKCHDFQGQCSISDFEEFIDGKIKEFRRLGIDIGKSESYYGDKKYITISISK